MYRLCGGYPLRIHCHRAHLSRLPSSGSTMGDEGALKPSSDNSEGALAALRGCGGSGPAEKPGGGGGAASDDLHQEAVG